MIGIIDYGMGNLRSVQKAFECVGVQATILTSPDQCKAVERLVLPGVGAFADGMSHLNQYAWSQAIGAFLDGGRPFLGICLGMQLLFNGSQEDAPTPGDPVAGLGVLRGQIVRFDGDVFGPGKLKVPHMGWNTIRWGRDDPLFAGLDQGCAVYFVHSYYAAPAADDVAAASSAAADYGGSFCASVWSNNIWATQFHPEKSQRVGLRMLANFANLVPR